MLFRSRLHAGPVGEHGRVLQVVVVAAAGRRRGGPLVQQFGGFGQLVEDRDLVGTFRQARAAPLAGQCGSVPALASPQPAELMPRPFRQTEQLGAAQQQLGRSAMPITVAVAVPVAVPVRLLAGQEIGGVPTFCLAPLTGSGRGSCPSRSSRWCCWSP